MAWCLILLDRKYEPFLWGLPWGLWQCLSLPWIISTRDRAAEELPSGWDTDLPLTLLDSSQLQVISSPSATTALFSQHMEKEKGSHCTHRMGRGSPISTEEEEGWGSLKSLVCLSHLSAPRFYFCDAATPRQWQGWPKSSICEKADVPKVSLARVPEAVECVGGGKVNAAHPQGSFLSMWDLSMRWVFHLLWDTGQLPGATPAVEWHTGSCREC